MRFQHFMRALAPVIGIALAAAVSGCDGKTSINIGGAEGKRLADLDISGPPPHEIVLAGPDEVVVTEGAALDIKVEGDPAAADKLRFTLKDGSLGIAREDKLFGKDSKPALVRVTMPAPRDVVIAGSGKLVAARVAPAAKVVLAGSGSGDLQGAGAESLDVTIAGSGTLRAAGTTRDLKLTVAGSGSAPMDALRVDKAKITVAGSGDAAFASDGDVDATIMGSGTVTVKGRARCKVNSMGSGRLVCEGPVDDAKPEPGENPAPPTRPVAPTQPGA